MKLHHHLILRSPLLPFNATESSPAFEEALYLASPDFYKEYKKYLDGKITLPKEKRKIEQSLYKYSSRASSRCTPYGLFAGVSSIFPGIEENITFSNELSHQLQRKTRLDMNVVCELAQELSKMPAIQQELLFYPNLSVYRQGDFYRYVEYFYVNNRRVHKLNKVDFSTYLQSVLEFCSSGKKLSQIFPVLMEQEVEEADARDFINELVAAQLLISEFQPTVTGTEFFELLLQKLGVISEASADELVLEIYQVLTHVKGSLQELDKQVLNPVDVYQQIFVNLKNILPSVKETNLFQVDLFKKSASMHVDTTLEKNIQEAYSFLNKLGKNTSNPGLTDFIKRFTEKYEEQEIPLSEALDTESGLGYPGKDEQGINDLIDDIGIMSNANGEGKLEYTALDQQLFRLLLQAYKEGNKVISLQEEAFSSFNNATEQLPPSMAAMFELTDVSTGQLYLHSSGGSSAINLLGRFGHGTPELGKLIEEIAQHEEAQLPEDALLAEIVHLPETRVGNILARPRFRNYEIPYLAQSTAASDFQIPLEDLLVSVRQNKVFLRSKRLNKQVIPRLGNAHNFSFNSLPVYRFLCDLQSHYFQKAYIGFSWGAFSSNFTFLPRAEFKNVILSPAQWRFKKKDFEQLFAATEEEAVRLQKFKAFKEQHQLPDLFLLSEGDNELLIDCNKAIAIDTFIETLKKREAIVLNEFLFNPEHPVITDERGYWYTNEFVAILFNQTPSAPAIKPEPVKRTAVQREFIPGSEWMYFKIYCGVKTADLVLTTVIKPLTEMLLQEGLIRKWFFIRYSDSSGIHTRLRMLVERPEYKNRVMDLFHEFTAPLVNERSIDKILMDTYVREIERYGSSSIELAESIFHNDSVCCVQVLDLLDADTGNRIRWKYGLLSVDRFLSDLGYSPEEKHACITQLAQSFFREHGASKMLKVSLDDKYRQLKKEIEELFKTIDHPENELFPLHEALQERTRKNTPILKGLLALEEENLLEIKKTYLISSYLHMLLNRLFMGRQRTNEFVVYEMLERYYKSWIARSVKQKVTIV